MVRRGADQPRSRGPNDCATCLSPDGATASFGRRGNAVPERYGDLTLLSAMITPAVLISACGTLIFSTSNRLGRIVDRVRELGGLLQQLAGSEDGVKDERRREL